MLILCWWLEGLWSGWGFSLPSTKLLLGHFHVLKNYTVCWKSVYIVSILSDYGPAIWAIPLTEELKRTSNANVHIMRGYGADKVSYCLLLSCSLGNSMYQRIPRLNSVHANGRARARVQRDLKSRLWWVEFVSRLPSSGREQRGRIALSLTFSISLTRHFLFIFNFVFVENCRNNGQPRTSETIRKVFLLEICESFESYFKRIANGL